MQGEDKECFVEFCVEKLDWPAQIPDLNTIKHAIYKPCLITQHQHLTSPFD